MPKSDIEAFQRSHQRLQGLVCTNKSKHFVYVHLNEELEHLPGTTHCIVFECCKDLSKQLSGKHRYLFEEWKTEYKVVK